MPLENNARPVLHAFRDEAVSNSDFTVIPLHHLPVSPRAAFPSTPAQATPVWKWACPGMLLEWLAGLALSTYPVHAHIFRTLRWEIIAFDKKSVRIA